MFNASCHEHQRQSLWNKLVVVMALVSVLGFFSVHAEPAHAATTPPSALPSVDQIYGGHSAAYHPTSAEVAYATDKERLSNEYVQRVRSGQETLANFETHYRAFMVKWHLGNVANLHTVLMGSAARLQSTMGSLAVPQCPVLAKSQACVTPTYAAQFPEESWNWCGPATLSTTLVEDSFAWPGANSYNGFTLSYNAFVVTQPSGTATNDELWLAQNGVISGDIYNSGTSVGQMNTMVNNFVNSHGGSYIQEWLSGPLQSQISAFQARVIGDIGTGWDVPTGIDIGAGGFYSLPGYPFQHNYISHWLPVTYISSDGNTTYYSDPVYAAPNYSSWGWTVPPPYESTSTSTLVTYASVILW